MNVCAGMFGSIKLHTLLYNTGQVLEKPVFSDEYTSILFVEPPS